MSAAEGSVRYERAGPVGRITIDRPDTRNAMTTAMYEQFSDCLDGINADSDARVVMVQGAGQSFMAGTDISQFRTFDSGEDGLLYESRLESIIGRLESVRVPTVAVIDGAAAGGGLLIAAACDIRICTPHARFGAPIARTVGNCLSPANTARLVALLGPARVRAMLLLADFMGVEEALLAGFIAEVVDRESIGARAAALCERIASHAPITMRVARESVRRAVDAGAAGAAGGDDLIRMAYGSKDFKEGVRAFIERRAPHWQDH